MEASLTTFERLVHKRWLRWSYVLVVVALNIFLIAHYSKPSHERLDGALRIEIEQFYKNAFATLPDKSAFRDEKRKSSGQPLIQFVDSQMKERFYDEELFMNFSSVVTSLEGDRIVCSGFLFFIHCYHSHAHLLIRPE